MVMIITEEKPSPSGLCVFLFAVFVKKKVELIFLISQNSGFVTQWQKYFYPFKPVL